MNYESAFDRKLSLYRALGPLVLGLALFGLLLFLAAGSGSTLTVQAALTDPSERSIEGLPSELHVCATGCDYDSVQAAVVAANDGDVIKIATGVYTGVNTSNSILGTNTQVVYISKSLTLAGGYTTTDWTTADPIAYPTIIDAEGQGHVILACRPSSASTNLNVTLEGLQITGSDTTGSGSFTDGGGFYGYRTDLNVEDSRFYNNLAAGNGGAIGLLMGSVYLNQIQLVQNTATIQGGGVWLDGSTRASLSNSQVLSNTAENSCGGAQFNSADLTIEDTIFDQNYGKIQGGAFCTEYGKGVISNSTFTDNGNYTGWASTNGGAIFANVVTTLDISGSTFSDNETGGRGGALFIEASGTVTLTANLVQDNWAGHEGGGIALSSVDGLLQSNAIVDNFAVVSGSGLWVNSCPTMNLHHTTIARNSGGDGTGLIATHTELGSPIYSYVNLYNTIVADQNVGVKADPGSYAILNFVLWENNNTNTSGLGAGDSNSYYDNVDFAPDGYHITNNSNAIVHANPNYTPQVTIDIDGQPRPMRSTPDIGADEYPLWPKIYVNTLPDLYPGDQASFSINIRNDDAVTHTLTLTNAVPPCLVTSEPVTWTAEIASGKSWVKLFKYTVASNYDGPCTKEFSFSNPDEELWGTLSAEINVIGAITTTVSSESGGELIIDDEGRTIVEITVGRGAVTDTTTLSYSPAADPDSQPGTLSFAGRAFDLSAYRDGELLNDFTFETGITVTLHYTDSDLEGLSADDLALYYWTGSEWATDGITRIAHDPEARTVTFRISHLSEFALFAPEAVDEYCIYLPMVTRMP